MIKKILAIGLLCTIMTAAVAMPIEQARAADSLAGTITDEVTNLTTYLTGNTSGAATAVGTAMLGVPMFDSIKAYEMTGEKSLSKTLTAKSKIISTLFTIVLQTLKKKLMDMIVDQIVNWIQGGGSPQFVTDWKGFLNKAGDIAFSTAITQAGAAQLCSPFKLQLRVALIPTQKFYKDEVKCTLNDVVANVKDFYTNFQNGGWLAYGKSWQPENNFAMQLLIADDNVAVQAQQEKNARQNESTSAQGFLSVKKCSATDQSIYNQCMAQSSSVGPTNANAALMEQCKQQACTKWDIVTPGSYAGQMVAKAAGSNLDSIISAQDLQQYVGAIVNAAINRSITEGLALMKGSNNTDTASTYTAPLENTMTQLQQQDKNNMIAQLKKVLTERTAVLTSKQAQLNSLQQTVQIYTTLNSKNCVPSVSTQDIQNLQTSITALTQDVATVQKQVDTINKLITEANNVSAEYRLREMDQLTQDYDQFVNNNTQLIGYSGTDATVKAAATDASAAATQLTAAQSRLTTCAQSQPQTTP